MTNVLVMVSVDKSCATTSTLKPGAQFLLTINIQPNYPDCNNIMHTIYNDLTLVSLTLSNEYM